MTGGSLSKRKSVYIGFPSTYTLYVSHMKIVKFSFYTFWGLFLPQTKIDNVTDPDNGQNDTGHKHICPHHHEKADPHYQRHRDDDTDLGLHRHLLFLYKGFQVLLVKLGAYKPVVKLLRGIGKADHRRQKKRYCRQDWQRHPDTAQP